jgi:hypothetical protein
MQDLVKAVKQHADEKFSNGWDYIAECWSDDEIVTMEAMAGTHTAEAIGRALGRTGRAVQSKAHDLGIPLKQYGQHHHMGTIPNEKREAYWAMVDGGMPKKHAALAVGVNPSTAQQWVRPVKRISE